MRILHVISQRPDSTGSGVYLQSVIKWAARAGHENFLVAGIQTESPTDLKDIKSHNCSFVHFETPEYPGKIVGMSDVMPYQSRRFRDLGHMEISEYLNHFKSPLQSAVERFRPDIIHSHHLWLLSSLTRELFPSYPVVASCHGSDLNQYHQCPHLRRQVRAGCRRLSAILALSSEQCNEVSDAYDITPEQIYVTGAGFDDSLFSPDPRRSQAAPPVILYAGKLSHAKGVPWLLQALINLNHFPFHLHLAGSGSGEERDTCMKYAAILGDKVTIHGSIPQDQLARLMQQSHIFVLPSLHEGLPLVVLEALASGCTVIATDLPGTREIRRHLVSNRLRLIEMPHILDTSSSELEDENSFIQTLESALKPVLSSSHYPVDDEPGLRSFTWQKIFQRIESIWYRALVDNP